MKPRSYICMPALFLSFLTAYSQKIKKEDRASLANLQTHVQSLTVDTAGGRSMGTPGEKKTGDYIISVLSQAGVKPRGDRSGWLQAFTIDEGRRPGPDAGFSIDDQSLELHRDWFPLAMCPAGQVNGSPAIALQESGVPWFVDLKDMLEGGAGSHAELLAAIRAKAAACARKGATAMILFNSSHHADRLEFDPKDRPAPAAIPVLYITKEAKKKYLPDESASVDLAIRISYLEQQESGNNVVAMLDKGAPSTVVIASRYDNNSGTAAMLELARLLAGAKTHGNSNYLFAVFSGKGPVRSGASWFAAHPPVDAKKIRYAIVLDGLGRLNDTTQLLTVGGYTSAWAPAWNAVREKAKKGDKHPLAFRYDSSAAAPGDQAVFYRQHIPTLVFSTGNAPENAGEPVNCEGELRVLKFIEALIERAP